jgi:XTP/dITP diphosphohydrolase
VKLAFVTSNKGKVEEARAKLAPLGIDVEARDLHPVEIQADTLDAIAREKARVLEGRLEPPFLVDDGGLFVHALRDFPGVFSAHALKTIGAAGILRLMQGEHDRSAHFAAVVAYHDGNAIHVFPGRCDGRILDAPRGGAHGFGFDPIFAPDGHNLAFSEMPAVAKNVLSHRGRALSGLVAHLRESR